ncbi:hypothetical protein HMPREF0083_01257 [Aneurinibacillus aneurinilyticus ATCC 12856]|jgi:hypothetical protein|uniref:Uncharacterized protein n=1 Tax=Aneurinibacillus aneurinilyticus ATCC 12856 TaxID=649747 RepID=U1WPV4_ANEAE|nr:hypothetical protein HMPREF0083_01257 [Aneurinibacillus aneurinilyticus ATCC 12856]
MTPDILTRQGGWQKEIRKKEEIGYVLRSGRRKASVSFSYLPPQKCVDLSNQMYINKG